jgi:hypothetical protein
MATCIEIILEPHLYKPSWCKIHSMATLVFPDPVGAHTSMFSLLYSAHSLTRLCTPGVKW